MNKSIATAAAVAFVGCILAANYESGFGVTRSQLEAYLALPTSEWTAQTLGALRVLGGELNRGEKKVADEFPRADEPTATSNKVTAAEIAGSES